MTNVTKLFLARLRERLGEGVRRCVLAYARG
jgi:hypothetical protein